MAHSAYGIRGVLFDNDGTLIDTYDILLESFQHATREVLGRSFPPEMLMRGVGTPLKVQMWDFASDQETVDRLTDVYRAYERTIHDDKVKTFPGVARMLAAIKAAGMTIGVVTSKKHASAMRGLACCKLDGYVDFLVGPDDYPAFKPEPGPVLFGCELAELEPRECLYVGDSPYDMRAGNAAGAFTAAALWGMFTREVLASEHPDFLCDGPGDVAALLGLRAFG